MWGLSPLCPALTLLERTLSVHAYMHSSKARRHCKRPTLTVLGQGRISPTPTFLIGP